MSKIDGTQTMPANSADAHPDENPISPLRRKMFLVSVIILIATIFIVGCPTIASHNKIAPPPLFKADYAELKSTTITPHLEEPIHANHNTLWCSTFQLVWNKLCVDGGRDIHMIPEPSMVAILNKKKANETDVNPDCYLLMSGLKSEGIVDKIRTALNKKFNGQASPDILNRIEGQLQPTDFLAYAYLSRELPFKCKFDRLKDPLMFQGRTKVASFGIRDIEGVSERTEQVAITDYKNADDFIFELIPEDTSERIILAKIAPAANLQETIEKVLARRTAASEKSRGYGTHLKKGNSLVIPLINFDLVREYSELYGKPVTTGIFTGGNIRVALQSIKFRLDESGAILKSEAGGGGVACNANPSSDTQLILDKPFLVMLQREKAEQPYFAMWVGSAELLVPFK